MAVLTTTGILSRYDLSTTFSTYPERMVDLTTTSYAQTTTDEDYQYNYTSLFDAEEYYVTYKTNNYSWGFYGSHWKGQTFTPTNSHTINWVYAYLTKTGTPSGNMAVSVQATKNLVDGYAKSFQDGNVTNQDHHPSDTTYNSSTGTSFENTTAQKITSCKLYLKKTGSPTGNGYAVLYPHGGTYGTGYPNGAKLATSDAFDVSTLTTGYQMVEFTFTGSEQYSMSASTYYFICFENPSSGTINTSNYISVGIDTSTLHGGNEANYYNGSWYYTATYSCPFSVYGDGTDTLIPSGTDLCSTTYTANDVTQGFHKFNFSTGASLTASTVYALVFKAVDGDIDNCVNLRYTAGAYSGGNGVFTLSSGESWSVSAYDIWFMEGEDKHTDDYIQKIEARIYGYGDGNDEIWLGWDTYDSELMATIVQGTSGAWSNYYDISFLSTDTLAPYEIYANYPTESGYKVLDNIWGTNEHGQTFTPDTTHTMDWLRASLRNIGSQADDLYLDIYNTKGIVDNYSESNFGLAGKISALHPSDTSEYSAAAQSFTCDTAQKITSCKFYLRKYGSPTGNAHAVLYAHSGTYGTSSEPTGSALATSDDFDVTTLSSGYSLVEFTFTGAEQYSMSASTYYVIAFIAPTSGTIDATTNFINIGADSSTPTHDGNYVGYLNSAWAAGSNADYCFYVYGNNGTDAIPTGSAIGKGKLENDYITVSSTWINIPLYESASLTANTKYAYIFSSPNCTSAPNSYAIQSDDSGTYTGGTRIYKSSGAWYINSSEDNLFYEGSNWWNFDDARFSHYIAGQSDAHKAMKIYVTHNDISKGGISYVGAIDIRITYINVTTGATYTISYPTDTLLQTLNETKDNKIDVALSTEQTKNMLIDGILLNRYIKSMDMDIILQKLGLSNYDIDLLLKEQGTNNFLIDLITILNKEKSYNIDGIIQSLNLDKNYVIDILLQKLGENDYNIDLLLKNIDLTNKQKIDVILQATDNTMDMLIDAIVFGPVEKYMTIDTLLQENDISKNMIIDTLFEIAQQNDMNIDLILQQFKEGKLTIDTILKDTNLTKDFLIDILIQKPDIAKSYLIDMIITSQNTKDYKIDMLLQLLESTKDFDIDAILAGALYKNYLNDILISELSKTKNLNIDLLLESTGLTKSHLIDIITQITYDKNYNIDLILKSIQSANYNIDVIVKELDVTKSYLIDIILGGISGRQMKIDILLKEYNVSKDYLIDILISEVKQNSHNIDTIISYSALSVDMLVDVILKQEDLSKNMLIDILIQSLDKTSDYTIDTLIKESNIQLSLLIDIITMAINQKQMSIDTLLKSLNITKETIIDIILSELTSRGHKIDILLETLDISQSYLMDLITKQTGISQGLLIDLITINRRTNDFPIDALIMSLNVSKSHLIDMVLGAGTMRIIRIDALLKAFDLSNQFITDVLLKITGLTPNYLIDTSISNKDIDINYIIDILITQFGVSRNYLTDIVMSSLSSMGYDIDTVLIEENLEGKYEIDALILKENEYKVIDIDTILVTPNSISMLIDIMLSKLSSTLYNIDILLKNLSNTSDMLMGMVLGVGHWIDISIVVISNLFTTSITNTDLFTTSITHVS